MLGLSGKHKKLVIGAAFVLGLSFSLLGSTGPTYAAPGDNVDQKTPSSQDTGQNAGSGDETTCAIEKMGWILCPIIETSGKVADSAFQQLAKHFLETEPELVASVSTDPNGTKPGTYVAWEFARNIANIMFIIAFLIIIFSQVTGQGINNYGIKKLLPKLVIAAVAVNISYYICQAMVDLTNIMGYEIQNFLVETARNVSDKSAMPIAAADSSITQSSAVLGNGTLAVVAIGALGLAGSVFILLPLLGSTILAILVVCLAIVIILLMRKAFIVLLVVASPIAFVMYLLPNTERLFQKWLKMFWQLLMVFPVVSLLFGGGQLASAIVLVAGTQQGQGTDAQNKFCADKTLAKSVYSDCSNRCVQLPSSDPKNNEDTKATIGTCGSRSTPLMLGLIAAGIAVAPLFAVWSVLKGALSAAGSIGGRVSGAVNSTSRKASKYSPEALIRKRTGENIQSRWQRRASNDIENNTNGIAGRLSMRKRLRAEKLGLSKTNLERTQQDRINEAYLQDKDPGNILEGLSPKGRDRAIRSGEAGRDRALNEDVQAASLTVQNYGDVELAGVIKGLTDGERTVEDPLVAAAINELGKRQNFAQLEEVLNHVATKGPSLATRTLSQTLSQNAPELVTGGQLGALSRGALGEVGFSGPTAYGDMVRGNIEKGIITPEKAASAGPSVLEEASRNATSQAAKQSLVNAASKAVVDPILNKKIGRNAGILSNFSQGKDAQGQSW